MVVYKPARSLDWIRFTYTESAVLHGHTAGDCLELRSAMRGKISSGSRSVCQGSGPSGKRPVSPCCRLLLRNLAMCWLSQLGFGWGVRADCTYPEIQNVCCSAIPA